MSAKDKVFTKVMAYSEKVDDNTIECKIGADIWTVQEDITIIGVQLQAGGGCDADVTVAGTLSCSMGAEISQTGAWRADGCIALVDYRGLFYTDTGTVRAVWAAPEIHARAVVMLPPGMGIPVKEGGTVYLNCLLWNAMTVVAILAAEAIIYYRKGA